MHEFEYYFETKATGQREEVITVLQEHFPLGKVVDRWSDGTFNFDVGHEDAVDRLHGLMEQRFPNLHYELI